MAAKAKSKLLPSAESGEDSPTALDLENAPSPGPYVSITIAPASDLEGSMSPCPKTPGTPVADSEQFWNAMNPGEDPIAEMTHWGRQVYADISLILKNKVGSARASGESANQAANV
jgi:hypothetical protein